MGWAAKWIRGLLGGGKKPPAADSVESSEGQPAKEKKKWGFGKSFREKRAPPRQAPGGEGLGGSYRGTPRTWSTMTRAYRAGTDAGMDDEEEQNKRGIAVAAATAAVAEAAVAAAQAAAAVVRLTSSGRGAGAFGGAVAGFSAEYGKREERAVVKIQSAFRAYLARRALRALRGLVKLQALVRGNIVRKQAAETLRCMQALVRVQARARACRALQSEKSPSDRGHRAHGGSPTPEKINYSTRISATKSIRSGTSRRNSCKSLGADGSDSVNSVGQNWLDGWMEERYHDSRTSSKRAGIRTSADDDKNAKILEIDSGKPHYSNRRVNNCSPCSTLTSDQNSRSFATMPESPSKDSTTAQQSVPSPASVDMQQSLSTLGFPFDVRDYEESPQFYSTSSRPGSSRKGPFTPAKSECSRSFFSEFSDYPNYMANTESSRAKFRSQSAPKQRPDHENPSSIKRSAPHAYVQNPSVVRSSLHAKFANKAYPGSGRLDRLGMPVKC